MHTGHRAKFRPFARPIQIDQSTQPLKEGQTFPLTLTFAKAGSENVTMTVQKVGSMGPGNQSGGMNMPGMDMPMHH